MKYLKSTSATYMMYPAGIRMRLDMFWWPRIVAEFHDVSSQTPRIKTSKKGYLWTLRKQVHGGLL